jgi:hypothetical protein
LTIKKKNGLFTGIEIKSVWDILGGYFNGTIKWKFFKPDHKVTISYLNSGDFTPNLKFIKNDIEQTNNPIAYLSSNGGLFLSGSKPASRSF